jgi:signal peptide peptidase-like protein 2B
MACSSPAVLLLLAALAGVAGAGDIVHQDNEFPKIPGCNNDFVLVRLSGPLLLVQLLWIP